MKTKNDCPGHDTHVNHVSNNEVQLNKPNLYLTIVSAICCLPIGIITICSYNKASEAYRGLVIDRISFPKVPSVSA